MMDINTIAKLVEKCAKRVYRSVEYGAADHNWGVNDLKDEIMQELALEYSKSMGLKRIVHIDERQRGDNSIYFDCEICGDYDERRLTAGPNGASTFHCQKCGALWKVDEKWSFAFNDEWSKLE